MPTTATKNSPRFSSLAELLASCLPLRAALTAAFERIWEEGDGSLHAECCGSQVRYSGGIATREGYTRITFVDDEAFKEAVRKYHARMWLQSPGVDGGASGDAHA